MSDNHTLEHHGIKGMRWGVRKRNSASSSSENKSSKKSVAKKVAIGTGVVALTVGAGAAVYVLNKHGKLPIKQISIKPSKMDDIPKRHQQTTEYGAKAAKKMSDTDAFKKLLKDMEADIADAHKEETRWMLSQRIPSYNPHTDPYLPKAELQRINNR